MFAKILMVLVFCLPAPSFAQPVTETERGDSVPTVSEDPAPADSGAEGDATGEQDAVTEAPDAGDAVPTVDSGAANEAVPVSEDQAPTESGAEGDATREQGAVTEAPDAGDAVPTEDSGAANEAVPTDEGSLAESALDEVRNELRQVKLQFLNLKSDLDAAQGRERDLEEVLLQLRSELDALAKQEVPTLKKQIAALGEAGQLPNETDVAAPAPLPNQTDDAAAVPQELLDRIAALEQAGTDRLADLDRRLGIVEGELAAIRSDSPSVEAEVPPSRSDPPPPVIEDVVPPRWEVVDDGGAPVSLYKRDVGPEETARMVKEEQCVEAGDWFLTTLARTQRDYNAFFVIGEDGVRVCEKGSLGWRSLRATGSKRAHLIREVD